MNKDNIEKLLSGIDDSYIAETVTYKNTAKKGFISTIPMAVKIAAGVIVVLAVGSLTTYAIKKNLRKPTVTKDDVRVVNLDYTGKAEPEYHPGEIKNELVEDVEGDESVNWINKKAYDCGYFSYTNYLYDDYDKALNDFPLDRWFTSFPGELKTVSVTVTEQDGKIKDYGVTIIVKYGDSQYVVGQDLYLNSNEEVSSWGYDIDKPYNERTYTNKNGSEFVIVDSEKYFGDTYIGTRSYVLFSYGDYYGYFDFHENITEEQKHEILDSLTF